MVKRGPLSGWALAAVTVLMVVALSIEVVYSTGLLLRSSGFSSPPVPGYMGGVKSLAVADELGRARLVVEVRDVLLRTPVDVGVAVIRVDDPAYRVSLGKAGEGVYEGYLEEGRYRILVDGVVVIDSLSVEGDVTLEVSWVSSTTINLLLALYATALLLTLASPFTRGRWLPLAGHILIGILFLLLATLLPHMMPAIMLAGIAYVATLNTALLISIPLTPILKTKVGLEKARVAEELVVRLLSSRVSGLIEGYSCLEGYKPKTVSLPSGVAPEGFDGEWSCCLLGCGGWGCAYRCERSGEIVVFKVPRGFEPIIEGGFIPTVNRKLLERVVEEANTIKALRHPNILRLYAASTNSPMLVYEYADYGSLEWQLSRGWKPDLKDILLIAVQVGDAIRYIHSRGLIHGDIKAGNIFIVKGVAKLGDFSSLTRLLAMSSSHSYACTPGWCAPEQLLSGLAKKASERGLEPRIDVYQLGNLVLYLLTGSTIDGREVVKPGKIEEYMKSVKHEKLREILKEMLSPEPSSRISSDESVKRFLEVYREVSE